MCLTDGVGILPLQALWNFLKSGVDEKAAGDRWVLHIHSRFRNIIFFLGPQNHIGYACHLLLSYFLRFGFLRFSRVWVLVRVI